MRELTWLALLVGASACTFSPDAPADASTFEPPRDGGGADLGEVGTVDLGLGDAGLPDLGIEDAGPEDLGAEDSGSVPSPFDFEVSNLDPSQFPASGNLELPEDQACVFSTDSLELEDGCSAALAPEAISVFALSSGAEVAVISVLDVVLKGRLELRGARGLVLLVGGDASLEGTLDASAASTVSGPGGDRLETCGARFGGVGGDAGGGGGGFSTPGGAGGETDERAGAAGGEAGFVAFPLEPLEGGCAGGGLSEDVRGGAGGGAVQVSVAGQLGVTGAILAVGGGGPGGAEGTLGGSGGGSGGAVLLEAAVLVLEDGARLSAAGGGGGGGGQPGLAGAGGEDGLSEPEPAAGGASSLGGAGGPGGAAEVEPEPGDSAEEEGTGGGGGGGASGVLQLRGIERCALATDIGLSPAAAIACP